MLDGEIEAATNLSERLSRVGTVVFSEAVALPFGNSFSNANKAIDHHFAWRRAAQSAKAPLTHNGNRLTRSVIALAGKQRGEEGFDTGGGYMT